MVEPSTVGDGNVTDVVVAAQAGLALVRVSEPIKDVVDKLRRETDGAPPDAGRRSPPVAPPADHRHTPIPSDMPGEVLLERRERAAQDTRPTGAADDGSGSSASSSSSSTRVT